MKPHSTTPVTRFCVTVDTEEEWDWASGYPTARPTVANIARLPAFQTVCERHAAAVVYFVNHAVLSDPELRATYDAIAGYSLDSVDPFRDASLPAVRRRVSFFLLLGHAANTAHQ